jgi:D-amino-acid dehydrogenase
MKATIIGGGIIGLSTALYLSEDGWDVTILERDLLTDNCSFGNMGYLSPSHFAPLAQPGIISQGILWMFDQKSPFYVRPSLHPRLIDWGFKFVRACTAGHVKRSVKPMVDLLLLSKKLTSEWQQKGMNFQYAEKGCINYFQTEKYEKAELENVRIGRDLGLSIDIISREEAHVMEPELLPNVRGGAWYKDDAHLHPNTLMIQLQALLEKRGVQILKHAAVVGFQKNKGAITTIRYRNPNAPKETQELASDLVVLAAGSWSAELAKMAGENLPLIPGKGYSMTVDVARQSLRHPCILLEAKVAITPWEHSLRIGSTMEIGVVNDRILFPRVQGILEAVPRFLPGYSNDTTFQQLADEKALKAHLREKVWYGFRPLSADGLPYIGFSKHTKNLMIATGHAMLGLSMAAATGKLVTELAAGKPATIDVKAFDPARY